MPVTTDTLYNIRKLNWVFAGTSVLTLGVMLWMMKSDFERPWRNMQGDYFDARSAMARFTSLKYESPEEKKKHQQLKDAVAAAEAALATPEMAAQEKALLGRMKEVSGKLQGAALTFGNMNAEIQVTAFLYEEHKTLHGEKDSHTLATKAKYDRDLKALTEQQKIKEALVDEQARLKAELKAFYRIRDEARKTLTAYEKGKENDKRNNSLFGGGFTRTAVNLPGADFLAPKGTPGRDEVKQVFMQDIRMNYNFLDTYTTDRCITCHVGIDSPDMSRENFIRQTEGALKTEAVVAVLKDQNERLRTKWTRKIAEAVANSDYAKLDVSEMKPEQRTAFVTLLVNTTNDFLIGTKRPEIDAAPLTALAGAADVTRGKIDEALRTEVDRILGAARPKTVDGKRELTDGEMSVPQQMSHVAALAAAMNTYLEEEGRPPVKFAQPLLAHPRLDLFVGPNSPHPMKGMGCTVCHEGSGQETDFVFAAHTPKNHKEEDDWKKDYYVTALGVPQATFHLVEEFWERPMLLPEYTSASCTKCHDQVMDLERHRTEPLKEAHNVVEGRKLFAQVGCINCHNVDSLSDLRRVGPDLQHVGQKLTTGFVEKWMWYPADFRPTTRMPHFFRQENNLPSSKNEDDPDPMLRTQTEVQAITHYLNVFTKPFDALPVPAGLTGDAARGEGLFTSIGCLACHANLDAKDPTDGDGRTFGERWITTDLEMREGKPADKAKEEYAAMSKNARLHYAKQHFTAERRDRAMAAKQAEEIAADAEGRDPDAKKVYLPPNFTRFAPELSGMGTKLIPTAGDAEQTARATQWLYNWLKDSRHYAPETKMPRLFEDNYYWKAEAKDRGAKRDQDILDLSAFLLSQRHDTFDTSAFPETDATRAETTRLIMMLLGGQNTQAVATKILADEKMDPAEPYGRLSKTIVAQAAKSFGAGDAGRQKVEAILSGQSLESRQKLFLGMKMISHYGCYACHSIPGFEDATRPGTDLSTWGQKFITQLDFAFYSPPFEHEIKEKADVFGMLYPTNAENAHLVHEIGGNIPQEILHNHGSFAYHKMRNPRIWDREKIKKPYDKLKMPNFYFTDEEAKALVTFLLSRKDKNVREDMQIAYDRTPAGKIAKGRALVHELNCIGCHTIEGNHANIQQYYRDDPSLGDADPTTARFQPPLLWGEGAKVQHPWLHKFLNHVVMLRPWLNVRMPTFYLSTEDATTLVEYFVGATQDEGQMLAQVRQPLVQYILEAHRGLPLTGADGQPTVAGNDWFLQEKFDEESAFLGRYAMQQKQIKVTDLNRGGAVTPAEVFDAVGSKYDKIMERTGFLKDVFSIQYPFPGKVAGSINDERFKLGEEFFYNQKCLACHVAGDPSKPGTTTDIKAPNFALTSERLRYDWVAHWVTDPQAIQPGANMPQIFQGGQSAFATMPPEQRAEFEGKFGKTANEQISLLVDFLFELGNRRYTAIQPGAADKPADTPADSPEGGFDFDSPAKPEGGEKKDEKKEEKKADFDF